MPTPHPYRTSLVALILVAALTGGATFLQGRGSGRWADDPVEPNRIANLSRLPAVVGLWRFEQEADLDLPGLDMVQSAGHSARLYRQQVTGRKVIAVALLGPAGPVSAHTPRICYEATGYKMLSESVQTVEVRNASGELEQHRFQCTRWGKTDLPGRRTVFHAWKADHGWEAPAWPRVAYATKRQLYSLQIIFDNDGGEDAPLDDAATCSAFLADYLPAADSVFSSVPLPLAASPQPGPASPPAISTPHP